MREDKREGGGGLIEAFLESGRACSHEIDEVVWDEVVAQLYFLSEGAFGAILMVTALHADTNRIN